MKLVSAAAAAAVSASGGSNQKAAEAKGWRRISNKIALQAQPVRRAVFLKRFRDDKSRGHRTRQRELVCGSREFRAVAALQRAKIDFRNARIATIAVRVRRDRGCCRHARLDARLHRERGLREQQGADQNAANGANDSTKQHHGAAF
ncbi:MAG: hypothetical protein HYV99_00820 [Betaproteobacteria bacterium]|nr:hypothetical protein [Betaproteobacteria bacterium]